MVTAELVVPGRCDGPVHVTTPGRPNGALLREIEQRVLWLLLDA